MILANQKINNRQSSIVNQRMSVCWPWQWFFPGNKPSRDPESGIVRRHHVHVENYSKAVRRAVGCLFKIRYQSSRFICRHSSGGRSCGVRRRLGVD
jgi:hypothetical protein